MLVFGILLVVRLVVVGFVLLILLVILIVLLILILLLVLVLLLILLLVLLILVVLVLLVVVSDEFSQLFHNLFYVDVFESFFECVRAFFDLSESSGLFGELLRGSFRRFQIGFYFMHIILPEVVYTVTVSLILYPIILRMDQKLTEWEQRSAKKFVS